MITTLGNYYYYLTYSDESNYITTVLQSDCSDDGRELPRWREGQSLGLVLQSLIHTTNCTKKSQ